MAKYQVMYSIDDESYRVCEQIFTTLEEAVEFAFEEAGRMCAYTHYVFEVPENQNRLLATFPPRRVY